MKSWMDTEFMEDGKTIELISIGIVREDGAEYYAENIEADLSKASDWVKRNVIPHLTGEAKPRWKIRNEVQAFVMGDEELRGKAPKPEIWGYYADYDWVVFCQLFGRMIDLPLGMPMYCRDVKQLCVDVGDPELPDQKSPAHHALNDARWTREAYLFCMKRKGDRLAIEER